jgi:hypothetical protein
MEPFDLNQLIGLSTREAVELLEANLPNRDCYIQVVAPDGAIAAMLSLHRYVLVEENGKITDASNG